MIEWIPHLKTLGVNALYIGPVFEASEHGYDTIDYYKIDRRLGDNHAFRTVCEELHKNDIRIVLDGVFNHVGRDFWAFQDVQRLGRHSQYCGWFQNLNFDGQSPMGDPFWYEGWQGHYNLVKLNLKNQDVVNHLLGAVSSWMDEFAIDGLRLDAADCIDPAFFKQLRTFCKQKKHDFWLMGEVIHGDYTRWANPDMLDSVTNYECYKGIYSSHNDKNYFEIAYSLNRQFGAGGIYKNIYTYNFADNHDVNRLMSTLRNEEHSKNVYTLLFTMPGIPSVYYGSEWGVQGVKQNQSDAPLRPCLQLAQAADADGSLAEHIGRLAALRQALPALRYGDYEQVLVKNEQFVYRRTADGQAVYIALNLAGTQSTVEFAVNSEDTLTDMLNQNSVFSVQHGHASIPVPPCSARILVKRSVQPPLDREEKSALINHKLGKYRHFKGNTYEVIGFARHSESLEEYVVYKALYGEHGLWVRPSSMFYETVEVNGRLQPRFEYIGG